jgi:aspartate/methionine/tyrosine aminotransferase
MKIARRAERIEPFYVMEVGKAAAEMARQFAGSAHPMIFLNIGEPDFTAPPLVQQAAEKAIRDGRTQYTHALGLGALRERISGWYAQRFGVDVLARRIVVTAGASAALQLACLALIEAGDDILMPDPSYPCNRHFVSAAEGNAVLIPTSPDERYQLSAAKVQENWSARTRGVLLASPSNPTGTSIHPDELRRIHSFVQGKGGITLLDEIYLGLSYEDTFGHTALAIDDQVVSINSFSKYFNMTGWRLGWVVAPERHVRDIEKLAQNLYISPASPSQRAALACFDPETLAILESRRQAFEKRRDFLVPALRSLGFRIPVMPTGGFFVYADCSDLTDDSERFCRDVLEGSGVAFTPGIDFGVHRAAQHVRLAYTIDDAKLADGIQRLSRYLGSR